MLLVGRFICCPCPLRTSTTNECGSPAAWDQDTDKQWQTAGTAKGCFVCCRPTTTVLATVDTVDFLYTCNGHLNDTNFASKVKVKVTAEEIAEVKRQWEEKQRRPQAEQAAKAEQVKGQVAKAEQVTEQATKAEQVAKAEQVTGQVSELTQPVQPSHDQYTLHRDFFTSRSSFPPLFCYR